VKWCGPVVTARQPPPDLWCRGDITVHGFRSTFRDWAAARTNFPSEVAQMALVHAVGDKVDRRRRRLVSEGVALQYAGCERARPGCPDAASPVSGLARNTAAPGAAIGHLWPPIPLDAPVRGQIAAARGRSARVRSKAGSGPGPNRARFGRLSSARHPRSHLVAPAPQEAPRQKRWKDRSSRRGRLCLCTLLLRFEPAHFWPVR
jgi:hypothetical protein